MIKKSGLNLKNVPDIPILHQMLSQSLQKPGEKLLANWRNSETLLFTLEVVCSLKDRDPRWLLICEKSGKRSVLCQLSGHDILLIYKQIATASANAQEVVARAEEAETATRLAKADGAQTGAYTLPGVTNSGTNYSQVRSRTELDLERPTTGGAGSNTFNSSGVPSSLPTSSTGTPGSGYSGSASPPAASGGPFAPGSPPPAIITSPGGISSSISAPARTRQIGFPLIGKIKELPLPKLLQIISSEKVTGLLQLEEDGSTASLFIQQGHPVEAKLTDNEGDLEGDHAFAEIMYWSDATYTFKVGASTPTRNLLKTSEIVLEHTRPLAQVLEDLTNRGMTADSVFKHAHENMTGEEFTAKATADAPVDMETLAALYLRLDGTSTMSDLENVQILPRPLLVRSIHHLVDCDIINFVNNPKPVKATPKPTQPINKASVKAEKSEKNEKPARPEPMRPAQPARPEPTRPVQQAQPGPERPEPTPPVQPERPVSVKSGPPTKPVVKPKNIDGAAIQSVMMSLRREDTGLFIHPAFLYFLEEEFFRIYRAKGAMSILLFEMREIATIDGAIRRKPLSIDAISDATIRINSKKRHTDVVAHYEAFDFGILLPSTKSSGAKVFAQKVLKVLSERPLVGMEGKQISFAFGSASIPEDFTDINSLLGAAEMAMHYARDRGEEILFFKDLLV